MRTVTLVPWASRAGGGIFEAVRHLAINLSTKTDVSTEVISLDDSFVKDDAHLWRPLAPKVLPLKGPKVFGYSPAMLPEILAAKPDVVHSHGIWQYHSWACLRWHKREHKPYVVSPHGALDPGDLIRSTWKKRIARIIYQGAQLQRAGCVHALCQAEAEAIRAFGITSKICVIPNGVDLPADTDGASAPAANDAEAKRSVLYLGRIVARKGIPALVDAWSRLRKEMASESQGWHLDIAGWEQYGHETELKAQVKALGLNDSVRFLGPRHGKEKAAAYRAAAAFVLPSTSEGLPLVVLEAWAYGLPVLMTPQCNIPEGFEANAAIRAECNAAGLFEGLKRLVTMSSRERAEMGTRGRKLVEERFTWPGVALKMSSVYKWIAGGGNAPDCEIIT
jgi:poly(glycerol-phosphate) alpha-glucosyltransferase